MLNHVIRCIYLSFSCTIENLGREICWKSLSYSLTNCNWWEHLKYGILLSFEDFIFFLFKKLWEELFYFLFFMFIRMMEIKGCCLLFRYTSLFRYTNKMILLCYYYWYFIFAGWFLVQVYQFTVKFCFMLRVVVWDNSEMHILKLYNAKSCIMNNLKNCWS